MTEQLKSLLSQSSKILITSHISPDPDAVASVLLFGLTLQQAYPDKAIDMVLEEKPDGLDFLPGFDQIKYQPLYEAIGQTKPNLLVLLDGNNFNRFSRHEGDEIRTIVSQNNIKTVAIDHHELAGKDDTDIFINNNSPATAMDVYKVLFDELALDQPSGSTQIAMTGFYADTGGFVYVKDGSEHEMFNFAERLVKSGADIEKVKNQLASFTDDNLKLLTELLANTKDGGDYSYSYLSDETIDSWLRRGRNYAQLQRATGTYLDDFVRNISGRSWGFIVYKNTLQGDNFYSVSFRSQRGKPDISIFAAKLGGGGHKPAAGARFEANDINDAITIVKDVIVSG